jgi:RNA-binding protein 25
MVISAAPPVVSMATVERSPPPSTVVARNTAPPPVYHPPVQAVVSSPESMPAAPATVQPVASIVMAPAPILSDDSISGLSHSFGATASTAITGMEKTSFAGVFKPVSAESPFEQQQKRKKMTVDDVFNNDDEEVTQTKKRKLIPLDYTDEERAAVASRLAPLAAATSAEEKRKSIKNLIERIPTAKDDLFAFPVDWTMVDATLMDRRIKPWVNKKIVEYIGEDEPTLSDFICKKVIAHSSPSSILADISMVLDDEAEVFVVKMWRLLIYETEAKKLGLVK